MEPNLKLSVLQFVTELRIGGTERHVVNLLCALDPIRFESHLACLRLCGQFLDEIDPRRIQVREYNVSSLWGPGALRQQARFGRYIRRNRIQVVHTYSFYPNVFALLPAKLAGVPVAVASIRDTGDLWTPMQRRAQRMACRLADCVVVNADAVRSRLITEGYDWRKIRVIRNGIDASRFQKSRADGGLRHELGLPPGAPIVAVISRLTAVKGVEFLLDAIPTVVQRFPDARFLIVGDGDAREGLERRAVRLGLDGRAVFTGFRRGVPEILSEVTVGALPSLSEATSNALLEAMAAGVPVVATRVGGNPEVVEDGVTGLLVPPGDPGALARAICDLLANPELAARFGRAGRRRVIQAFSLERMIRETEGLYSDLASEVRRLKANGCEPLGVGLSH